MGDMKQDDVRLVGSWVPSATCQIGFSFKVEQSICASLAISSRKYCSVFHDIGSHARQKSSSEEITIILVSNVWLFLSSPHLLPIVCAFDRISH